MAQQKHFCKSYKLLTCALLVLCWLGIYMECYSVNIKIESAEISPSQSINHSNGDKIYFDGYPLSKILRIEIMIASFCSPNETKWRSQQRGSWMKYIREHNKEWKQFNKFIARCNISYHYFIGNCPDTRSEQIIQTESEQFGDIIRIKDYTESWNSLQLKTLKMILHEYSRVYNEFPFDILLKADSDIYIDIPSLCRVLISIFQTRSIGQWNSHTTAMYIGSLNSKSPIITRSNYKFPKYINKNWSKHLYHDESTENRFYLPYMEGASYCLSYKTVQIIYNALRHDDNLKQIAYNKVEDAYIGHLLSAFNVQFVHSDEFKSWQRRATIMHCDGARKKKPKDFMLTEYRMQTWKISKYFNIT